MRAHHRVWKLQVLVAVIAVIIAIFLMTAQHVSQLKSMTAEHNAQLLAVTAEHNVQLVAEADRCKARLAEQAAR
jgi:hypothetical protein